MRARTLWIVRSLLLLNQHYDFVITDALLPNVDIKSFETVLTNGSLALATTLVQMNYFAWES